MPSAAPFASFCFFAALCRLVRDAVVLVAVAFFGMPRTSSASADTLGVPGLSWKGFCFCFCCLRGGARRPPPKAERSEARPPARAIRAFAFSSDPQGTPPVLLFSCSLVISCFLLRRTRKVLWKYAEGPKSVRGRSEKCTRKVRKAYAEGPRENLFSAGCLWEFPRRIFGLAGRSSVRGGSASRLVFPADPPNPAVPPADDGFARREIRDEPPFVRGRSASGPFNGRNRACGCASCRGRREAEAARPC